MFSRFRKLKVVTDRQTNRQTTLSVCSNRPNKIQRDIWRRTFVKTADRSSPLSQQCCVSDDSLKAKFHYAILVADRSEAGRRPAV